MDEQERRNRIRARIKKRMIDLQGKTTTRGEPISEAAIARVCDPPVTRVAVHLTTKGVCKSPRIREQIEHELGETYWIRRKAA